MKGIYIFLDTTSSEGVVKKVKAKIKSLNNAGLDIKGLFLNANIKHYSCNEAENIYYVPLPEYTLPKIYNRRYVRNYNWFFSVNYSNKHLYYTLTQALKSFQYDYIILRYPLSNKFLLNFIKNKKVIIEHNTKELEELEISKSNNRITNYIYNNEKKYGPKVISLAKGIIAVTPEILEYEIERSDKKNIPATFISNGIDYTNVKTAPLKTNFENELNLLLLCGSKSEWHGEDRLLKGLINYKGDRSVKLFLVGEISTSAQKIIKETNFNGKIICTGVLSGPDLDEVFNKCQLGIGTLAVHRKGLKEAVSLKVREYLSRGLPCAIAYIDSDLKNSKEISRYVLSLPSGEGSIDIQDIVDFYDEILKKKNFRYTIQNLSRSIFDIDKKAQQYKDFVTSSLGEGSGA